MHFIKITSPKVEERVISDLDKILTRKRAKDLESNKVVSVQNSWDVQEYFNSLCFGEAEITELTLEILESYCQKIQRCGKKKVSSPSKSNLLQKDQIKIESFLN